MIMRETEGPPCIKQITAGGGGAAADEEVGMEGLQNKIKNKLRVVSTDAAAIWLHMIWLFLGGDGRGGGGRAGNERLGPGEVTTNTFIFPSLFSFFRQNICVFGSALELQQCFELCCL